MSCAKGYESVAVHPDFCQGFPWGLSRITQAPGGGAIGRKCVRENWIF
jgi:hypothetical protein